MIQIFILIGIVLGVAWRIGMPFFRKVMDGKITIEEFDIKYVYEGLGTLVYATPIGILLFFQFAPPEASTLIVFLAAFAWGYTAQNLTDGAPAWLNPILVKLGLRQPKKPDNPGHGNVKTDNPDTDNPGSDNPGHNKEKSNASKIVDWFLGRNGSDPTRKAEARLELIVFAPIQYFFMLNIWELTRAISANNWDVAHILFGYLWKMAIIAIALLWGRNIRSWLNQHATDWLSTRQERKLKETELQAKLASFPEVAKIIVDAVQLVASTKAAVSAIPDFPVSP